MKSWTSRSLRWLACSTVACRNVEIWALHPQCPHSQVVCTWLLVWKRLEPSWLVNAEAYLKTEKCGELKGTKGLVDYMHNFLTKALRCTYPPNEVTETSHGYGRKTGGTKTPLHSHQKQDGLGQYFDVD